MLDKQIRNQESYLNELEIKVNIYQESAKQALREGDKSKCKRILVNKKKFLEKMKTIEGMIFFIEEQKFTLENMKRMRNVLNEIENGSKALKEEVIKLNPEILEEMKAEMEDLKNEQEELNEFFNAYKPEEEEEDKKEKKDEDKKEDQNEGKKEDKKEKKDEDKKEDQNEGKKEDKNEKKDEDKKEDKNEVKKEEIQIIEDNENNFEKYKEEGYSSLKESVLAIIFAKEGISFEGLKRIKDNLDDAKKKYEKITEFFKKYGEENEVDS